MRELAHPTLLVWAGRSVDVFPVIVKLFAAVDAAMGEAICVGTEVIAVGSRQGMTVEPRRR
jgi:hypothetical protein